MQLDASYDLPLLLIRFCTLLTLAFQVSVLAQTLFSFVLLLITFDSYTGSTIRSLVSQFLMKGYCCGQRGIAACPALNNESCDTHTHDLLCSDAHTYSELGQ